jgi:hypothetical protein
MLFKIIDVRIFLITLALGLFYIYITDEYKKIIIIYPTPDNVKTTQYKDKTDNCFTYDLNEVKCPKDDDKYFDVKMQK